MKVETTILYRPVGPKELELIRASGNRAFPPRLPEQPIFYPVLNEEYANDISRKWNVKDHGAGYVTRFMFGRSFLRNTPFKLSGTGPALNSGFRLKNCLNLMLISSVRLK